VLVLDPPPPGETRLRRRIGEFHGFVRDLVEYVERQVVDGTPLGSRWDVEGDPAALRLAELWAFVAEGVAAYTELAAGETYLPTAQDWTDVRRIAALVGFRPRPAIAAQGWVMAELDRGAAPLVPAGTRVQAPATPERPAQTYEVVADTQLRVDWAGMTATWVPQAAVPRDRTVRFLGDPGFGPADRVLFVLEKDGMVIAATGWVAMWAYILGRSMLTTIQASGPSSAQAIAIATATAVSSELGTTLVKFDRNLDELLGDADAPYAAYRVLATAAPARQIDAVLRIPAEGAPVPVDIDTTPPIDLDTNTVTLDRPLDNVSKGQLVAVVDWAGGGCDIAEIDTHAYVDWHVAPGTPTRVSTLKLTGQVNTLASVSPLTFHVLDRRVVARHYVFPAAPPETDDRHRLRLYPPPAAVPNRIAVGLTEGERTDWQVLECKQAADQEQVSAGAPSGLIVDLVHGDPADLSVLAPASANLLRVRHGTQVSAVLGSGDATQADQRFTTADAPIAYDLDESGNPVPSMVVRVAGVRWDEVPSLYGVGAAEVYGVRRGPDGAETLEFGGARLPTGSGNVAAIYRVGGGEAGEVPSGAIQSLLGSVRGVKKVLGAGPTEGGADQDDEHRLRRLAPTRARAFGRAVSAEDLVDLALGYPGVTHAVTFDAAGPQGCPCNGVGLHLAFIRRGEAGPRPALPGEILSLAGFLDARRDPTVPLCVCSGVVTNLHLTVALAVDPRREPAAVAATVTAALADPAGPLGPDQRALGQALDRSDVFAVIHAVAGVVGVATLDLPGADSELGRRGAKRYELLVPSSDPSVTGAPA